MEFNIHMPFGGIFQSGWWELIAPVLQANIRLVLSWRKSTGVASSEIVDGLYHFNPHATDLS